MTRIRLFTLMTWIAINAIAAEPISIKSPVEQTTLLELYTSEGCSSCPAADRWLSKFKQDSRLWRQVIPVAFHVDYWNYLGWKDPYASAKFSQRQRNYQRLHYLKSVYTPGFVKNGREWRSWFGMRLLKLEKNHRVGVLRLTIKDKKLSLDFKPELPISAKLQANIAILGIDIHQDIATGENQGKTLQHDFVVLEFQNKTINKTKTHYSGQWPWLNKTYVTKKLGIAVWLSETNDPTPIQAVGGWL